MVLKDGLRRSALSVSSGGVSRATVAGVAKSLARARMLRDFARMYVARMRQRRCTTTAERATLDLLRSVMHSTATPSVVYRTGSTRHAPTGLAQLAARHGAFTHDHPDAVTPTTRNRCHLSMISCCRRSRRPCPMRRSPACSRGLWIRFAPGSTLSASMSSRSISENTR